MSFLSIDYSLFERMTGFPLDAQGRPQKDAQGVPLNRASFYGPEVGGGPAPSYGIRIPILKSGQKESPGFSSKTPNVVRLFDKGFEPDTYRQVPIFSENLEGREWESVWPCVTFRYVDQNFVPDTYQYNDPIGTSAGAAIDITNSSDEVIQSGTNQRKVRRHPEEWDPVYMLRVYTKNPTELHWIEHQIRTLFPARGAISVPLADGTTAIWDMLLEGYENLDYSGNELPMSQGPGQEQRYYSRGFTYRIEAYVDNTTPHYGSSDISFAKLITQRILEIVRMQDHSIVETYEDLNKLEHQTIP